MRLSPDLNLSSVKKKCSSRVGWCILPPPPPIVFNRLKVGNANPANERAQARVYALWSFAKAYVQDKDRVSVDGGKVAEIRVRRRIRACRDTDTDTDTLGSVLSVPRPV